MKKKTTSVLLKFFVLMLTVIIGVGFWSYHRKSEVVAPETGIILLPELKWGSYRQIKQALQRLPRKLDWRLERRGWEASVLSPIENGLLEETVDAVYV